MKTNKFEIRPINPEEVLTGANCEVLMNGDKLSGVQKVSFEVQAGKVGKINLEMVGNVTFIGEVGEVDLQRINLVPEKKNDQES